MATPQIVTVRDFTTSRYAQLAENTEGQLTDILARAEAAVQSYLGRSLSIAAYTEVFRAPAQTIFLRNRPIVSLTSVRRRVNVIHAWEPMTLSRFRIEANPGYIEAIDPVRGYELEVVYTAGIALPEDLKEAILMQAVLFSFQDLEIYGSGDAKAPGITYMQQDIHAILDRHKHSATVYH